MKLLLDTHIWIWSSIAPELLRPAVTRELQKSANELWLSPLSIWELLLLLDRQRVQLNQSLDAWVARSRENLQLNDAPVTSAVALDAVNVLLPHRDPIDRLLIATARVFDLTLVTADRNLIRARGVSVLPNR